MGGRLVRDALIVWSDSGGENEAIGGGEEMIGERAKGERRGEGMEGNLVHMVVIYTSM